MTRRPPDILGVAPRPDGGLEVSWRTDEFFADSEDPERVFVSLNGQVVDSLDGDETSATIESAQVAALPPGILTIGVVFWWSGEPAEAQQSAVQVPVSGGPAQGNAGVEPAAIPVVGVAVEPRTASSPLRLRISWESNNYNDGEIVWGPRPSPDRHRHSIRPSGTVYRGTWTTDQELTPATLYRVTVRVRNTLHSPTWLSTSVWVRTPDATLSVRQFLVSAGRDPAGGVRAAMAGERSVRRWLTGA